MIIYHVDIDFCINNNYCGRLQTIEINCSQSCVFELSEINMNTELNYESNGMNFSLSELNFSLT